jgi:hypothetical protein
MSTSISRRDKPSEIEDVPSEAKAHLFAGLSGTAEAMPFPRPIF